MELVTWLTDDRSFAADVELAAQHAGVELQIVDDIAAIPPSTAFVLWYSSTRDAGLFEVIETFCIPVITIVKRGAKQDRLCRHFQDRIGGVSGPPASRYYLVLPFDPEEAGLIIRFTLDRIKAANAASLSE